MPGRDKTGPVGQGPMTGRGLGNCTGGRGDYGRGFGGGFGFRHGFGRGRGYGQGFGFHHGYGNAYYSSQDEKQWLENEIHSLKDQLAYFEKRLSDQNKDGNQNVEQ